MKQETKQIETPLNQYIKNKHSQEECIGFIDGFNAAKEQDKAIIEGLSEILKTFVLSAGDLWDSKQGEDFAIGILLERAKSAIIQSETHTKN